MNRTIDRPGMRGVLRLLSVATLLGAADARGASYEDIKEAYQNCFGFCQLQFGAEQRVDACCSVSLTILTCSKTCILLHQAAHDQCLDSCADTLLSGNIDVVATLLEGGRRVRIGGPLACTLGFKVAELTVTITQPGAPGVAAGRWKGDCSGSDQRWETIAGVRGDGTATLSPGGATACAVAEFAIGGRGVEAKQWCQEVTLVPAGSELEP